MFLFCFFFENEERMKGGGNSHDVLSQFRTLHLLSTDLVDATREDTVTFPQFIASKWIFCTSDHVGLS